MKLDKNNKEKKTFNFDFSIYEDREDEFNIVLSDSIRKLKREVVTTHKSKFSPGAQELEKISLIRIEMSKLAMKVASNTQDINILWKFYGCMNEYWANIKDVFGRINYYEIEKMLEILVKIMDKYKDGYLPYDKVHKQFLKVRDYIYILAQRKNLGFETEKQNRSYQSKARRGIVQ